MRIIEVSKELGISPTWIRQLEREGRIPKASRDINGHRRFSEYDVRKLREVIFSSGGKK